MEEIGLEDEGDALIFGNNKDYVLIDMMSNPRSQNRHALVT